MPIMVELSRAEKRRLRIWIQREKDAGLRMRMSLILHLARGWSAASVAASLHVARSTVYRVAQRFNDCGWSGLPDRREDNGAGGVDEFFLRVLRQVVRGCPRDYGWARPTWTQELLCLVMKERSGRMVSQPTLSRCLKAIGARLGRPRPTVGCPWSPSRKNRHARRIRRLIDGLGPSEVAFFADELDVHLNPKIGRDWMLPGQQKVVVTPGKNYKRYLAGARDARTGRMHWVEAAHKRSGLFIELLRTLDRAYPTAERIFVIVDNYSIHLSRQTQWALSGLPRIQLHFLPPCSPDLNPIERVWLDLHAEVTRNHRCKTIDQLMREVHHYLKDRNRQTSRTQHKIVA